MTAIETIFIFGAGFSGRAIGREAAARGITAYGTTRLVGNAEALRSAGLRPLIFKGEALSRDVGAALAETTHLIVSVPPRGAVDPVLFAARGQILSYMPQLRWIGYLSTVGVYGDHGGEWVDERARCRPKSTRSSARLQAENAWQGLAIEAGLPLAILRLSGIYGPGRNGIMKLADGTAKRIVKPGQVFNRIHVEDIAGAVLHLAERQAAGIYNVTDDEPGPPQEVVAFTAEMMGIEPPPEVPFAEAEMSEMARSFYGDNKRVANDKLKEAGYRLRFPDYRTGLTGMWSAGNWDREPELAALS